MRRAARLILIVLALLILIALGVPFLISANRFKPALETKLSAALGRQVKIGNLDLSILRGAVTADSLSIADDPAFGSSPFLEAKSLKVGVELWPLITSRKLNVTGVTIEQPQVTLLQLPSGRWNYSSLGGKTAQTAPPAQDEPGKGGLDMSAKAVRIADGRFAIGKVGRQKPLALDKVNLEVRDFSASTAFPFSFTASVAGGGEIKIDGKAGPIDGTDVELTPLSVKLAIARLNLASALADTAPDIGGIASLDADGASAGGRLTIDGKLKAEGLKLARNGKPAQRGVELDIRVQHDLTKHSGALDRGDIHIGTAVAHLTGTYASRGEAMWLAMKFAGTKMPVPELAALLPALGVALPNGSRLEGGTATAAFAIQGPADAASADGSVSLDNTRLANFDLGKKMTLIETVAGIKSGPDTDIETLGAKLKYTPQGTAVEDLRLVAQGIGELNGAGTVSPANALDFQMKATVQTSRSAALSKMAVPFFIQGTAMDPVFKPDVRGLAQTQGRALLESEAQKRLKGPAGAAAAGVLDKLFGGKKK